MLPIPSSVAIGRVHRARAAEGDEREAARIVAARDRDDPQGAHHRRVCDPDDRSCSLLDAETERPRDVELDRPSSGGRVEPDAPAEEARWIERSEDEVRVRHRRGFAARSVRPRARDPRRRSPGRPRASRTGRPGDAAAAGADREDVALREVHGVSGRVATKPHLRVAVDDEAHIGGRAAHVEAEDAFASGGGADLGRANHPGRGPRGDERDRKSLRLYRPATPPFDCMRWRGAWRPASASCRSSASTYRPTSGRRPPFTTVVLVRKYSRNSGATREEIVTGTAGSFSQRSLAASSSCAGFANEKRKQTATASIPTRGRVRPPTRRPPARAE